MKASIDLTTGKLIESQSDASDETMMANAANVGFTNVAVREVTEDDLRALITTRDADPKREAQAEIDALEAQQIKAGARFDRETKIAEAIKEAAAVGITLQMLLDPTNPAYSPGFSKFYALNQTITTLRHQL